MTNLLSPSEKARPWRSFSLTIFACLASSALLSVACSSTGTDDMGTGGSAPGAGGSGTGVGGSGTGVGGSASGTGGGAACDIPALLNLKCGASICHGTNDLTVVPSGNVNLVAPGVEGRIYNVDAVYANFGPADDPALCPTTAPEKLVDPAGLPTSLMYTKINGGHACGAKMPNVGTVTAEQIACYNDWLASIIANPPQ